ncbi:hypothetical protein M378DRAFT_908967 [Amanita muscaria Koide BX008]|uniref:Uncharacterized protein n=1 Tax=Amanita muscaria (strain Koide BX008) TaxID=946122 RepID=A0A0C2SCM7_AMAMK|nr:hypothetical protein M378DRAFT_908967 [Amanita muscaria Koide BX008]
MELNQEIHDYFDSNPEAGRIHVVIQLPDKIYGEICLNVLIDNALVAINIYNNGVVKNIYEKAKALLPEDVKRMISDLETSKLIFEQIDPPIMFQPGSDDAHVSDETARECHEAEKKMMMNQMQIVDYFSYDSLSEFHIHVIIRPPDDAIQNAINNMKRVDSSLYKRLQVRRMNPMNPSAWSNADYPLVEIGTVAAHKSFQELLDKRRTYNLESGNRFLKLALSVLGKKMFSEFVFENAGNLPNNFIADDPATVSDGPATVSGEELELLIFSTLEPAFVKRIKRFKGKNASSHFKQALFLWHFVLHPALAVEEQGRLILTTENESQIKYYVMCPKDGGWRTTIGSYTPRSDMAIISKKLGCPFLLCEVDSNQTRKDKHRMLAVATSAARVGQYLLKKGTADVFVLMALFVTKDLVVERYLVSETNVDDSDVRVAMFQS